MTARPAALLVAMLAAALLVPLAQWETAARAQEEEPPSLETEDVDPETAAEEDESGEPVRVTGSVTDLAGEPVRGARVTVSRGEGRRAASFTAKTDKKGRWGVLGPSAGRWRLRVEAEGFLPADGSVVVPGGAPPEPVEVALRSLEETPPIVAEGDPAGTAARWIERGDALLAQGRPAEARAEYERALAAVPPDQQAPVLQGIARTHFLQGDVETTIETLERALRLAPRDEDLRKLYRALFAELDRAGEAEAFLGALPEDAAPAPGGATASEPADPADGDLPPEILARLAAPPETPDPAMTGHHEVTLGERSPLGGLETFLARSGWSEDEVRRFDPAAGGYELESESFHLYVPPGDAPPGGWGLLVWIAPQDWGGFEREGLAEVIDGRGLIWVGANRAGNARPVWDRWALALDAAAGVSELFSVDPERIYVAGYSGGGRVASALGTAFPEVFRGALCWFGVDHFHPVPVPDRPGTSWAPRFPEPPAETLERLRSERRFVLVTGERDFNRAETVAIAEHLQADGFEGVELMVLPEADHYIGLDPAGLEQALGVLDAGR